MLVMNDTVPEEGRYWVYALAARAGRAGFDCVPSVRDRKCDECQCPIPCGHYFFRAFAGNTTHCFECVASDPAFESPVDPPACLEPYWDRGVTV